MINPKRNNLEAKKELYILCYDFVDNRRKTIQNTIKEIQESLTSETKSSAGDKHETGRAMLQLEREKLGHQLAEIEKLEESLSKIDTTVNCKTIGLGSIVYTTQANYFIAISSGKMEVNGTEFYAISTNTPIGLLLMGKNVGDEVVFREQNIKILNVV
jgi:transcription elongation GreA/GreB family factor